MTTQEWIPTIEQEPEELETDSWFNIRKYKNSNFNSASVTCTPEAKLIRSRKIKLFPTPKQSEILLKWLDLSRRMYNETVKFLNSKIYDEDGDIDYAKMRIYLNNYKLRDVYLKEDKRLLLQNSISSYILNEAISRCAAMYKSSLTNYKNSGGDVPTMRIIKKTKRYKWLNLTREAFSKKENAFCVKTLGTMKSESPIKGIRKSCTLHYDRLRSSYVLIVPEEVELEDNETKGSIAGIDPGIRTFLTVYSKDSCYEISTDHNFSMYHKKIDKLNKNFEKGNGKKTRRYQRAIGKVYDKMNNRIRDLHFKVSHFLCKNFKDIRLGKISTAKMSRKATSVLSKKTKRIGYTLAHYKFRMRLQYQCQKYGVDCHIVNEYMTTKTCSKCGYIKKDIGANKVYNCNQCGMIADRDINAARNMRFVEL